MSNDHIPEIETNYFKDLTNQIIKTMKDTELAYTYNVIANIMHDDGHSDDEIEAFLIEHQNDSGYIKSSLIPYKGEL